MKTWARLLFSATALSTVAMTPALAAELDEKVQFNIAPGSLDEALIAYSNQADLQVISASSAVRGKRTAGVSGDATPREALAMLLKDSGLSFAATSPTTVTVSADPQGGSAAGAGAEVEALIVTAQKREEDIQDVPIAISAFTQEALDAQKIEGGFDLLKAIPNVTFSKNNFTSYNFSIRGVGTKAVSATTDPGVAVAFNNSTIIQNRLFEQEYFDVERVEVLRGPQGTLYGRNATSGVINVISAKPDLNGFEGSIKGEVGNFDTKRVSAMVNVPLIEDVLAVRVAGALTSRQGYDYNSITRNAVNGRELWSGRVTVGFEPTERLRGNLIWERFEEDDNRSRTGKQLCHRDDGPVEIDGTQVVPPGMGAEDALLRRALFSQGCKGGGLYEDAAFGTPNGLSLNFVYAMLAMRGIYRIGDLNGVAQSPIKVQDPYDGMMQSRDLREIASFRDPVYRAGADLLELNFDFDVTDSLTFSSQTAYVEDETYSFQDYNRFNTVPIFTDTAALTPGNNGDFSDLAPGGVFCDPQLGCSNTMAGFDIAQATAKQFSQEFRLQSYFDGPLNFSFGANYTSFEALADYYVMYNLITAYALTPPFNRPINGQIGWDMCYQTSAIMGGPPVPTSAPNSFCPYVDPNPVESIDGEGHNYFRSKNPYEMESRAAFGEVYWEVNDALKVTAGLRYTDDRKTFTPVPSQVLLGGGYVTGGYIGKGYPEEDDIVQKWGEWTGRLGVDWQPELAFTDQTMLYGFYSRGYKGGGANPPSPGFATGEDMLEYGHVPPELAPIAHGLWPVLELTSVEYGPTFEPEFVNAFEIGAKNTLLDGALMFNATAFYYDYKDYQVSQIRDRTAVNENFDAEVWGLEFETVFSPTRDLQIVANLGYLDTKVGDGETSIDIMNRTQDDPGYVVVKPWAQLPSNCVVPVHIAAYRLQTVGTGNYFHLCGGYNLSSQLPVRDPAYGNAIYDRDNYPELNGGAGLLADLSGNELPNAPHWTANVGAQYGMDILDGNWRATIRGDVYWQSQSYHRIYNWEPYDKLRGWYNANLSLWIERPDDGLKIELYAKNIFDDTPITDAFLNSDDTGLTTNVFTLDPRLIGLSIRKEF